MNNFLLHPDNGVDARYLLIATNMFVLQKQLDLAQKQLDKSKKTFNALSHAHEMLDEIEYPKAKKMVTSYGTATRRRRNEL